MYDDFAKIVCLGDLKQAALYYDHIVPLLIRDIPGFEFFDEKNTISDNINLGKKVLSSLFVGDEDYATGLLQTIGGKKPPGTYTYPFFNIGYEDLKDETCKVVTGGYNFYKQEILSESFDSDMIGIGLYGGSPRARVFPAKKEFIRKAVNIAIDDCNIKDPNVLYPPFLLEHQSGNEIFLALTDTPLIDTSKADWEQIIEIRKDEDARRKLKKLRLFLSKIYDGKSRSFVEDDLEQRLYDYDEVIRAHGFETVMSTISLVSKSNSLLAASILSLTALLLGDPIISSNALATGISLELSRISMMVAKEKYSLNQLRTNHELAYIIESNDKFREFK